MNDVRYALRVLLKSPVFTLVAVLTLALGIGANTALFSILHAVLVRPFPFAQQDRLAILWERDLRRDEPFIEVSYPDFLDWREQTRTFEDLAAMPAVSFGLTLTGAGAEPIQVQGRAVTGNFFDVLGARPALGRTFLPEEDRTGAARVAVLSHGLWQRRFRADPGIVGNTVTLEGEPFTVVGVMPAAFRYPQGAELWTPLAPSVGSVLEMRGVRWLLVVGRMMPDVALEEARAEMDGVARQIWMEHAGTSDIAVAITPLVDHILGATRPRLLLLMGAVALVLLIACANVANLLLARATERRREIATRLAIGATRARIIRQLLAEGACLAGLGAGAGVLLAWWTVDAVAATGASTIVRLDEARVDRTALAFSAAIALGATVASALLPAMQASGVNLLHGLRAGRRDSGQPGQRRAQRVLVAAEVALAAVVLIGAGLAAAGFAALQRADLGFVPQRILTLEVPLSGPRYAGIDRSRTFFAELLDRVRSLPGVQAAAGVHRRPLWSAIGLDWPFQAEGQDPVEAASNPLVNLLPITPDFFRAMGIPLLRGRDFADQDDERAPPVAIVSESFAARVWPGQDPLGRRISMPVGPPPDYGQESLTVIGVAADVRHREIEAARLDVYMSFLQFSSPLRHLVVRAASDPAGVAGSVIAEVRALDPDQPVDDVRTMEEVVAMALGDRRFGMQTFLLFALLALVLSAAGIYGVVAYVVSQRTCEIGIRMALGASAGEVIRLSLAAGLLPASAGTVVGVGAGIALARAIEVPLIDVGPGELWMALGVVAGLLGGVTLLASYLPARRAARVDPVVALRAE